MWELFAYHSKRILSDVDRVKLHDHPVTEIDRVNVQMASLHGLDANAHHMEMRVNPHGYNQHHVLLYNKHLNYICGNTKCLRYFKGLFSILQPLFETASKKSTSTDRLKVTYTVRDCFNGRYVHVVIRIILKKW